MTSPSDSPSDPSSDVRVSVTYTPEKLPTGSMVEVASVVSAGTLEVNPVSEPAAAAKAGQ